MIKYQIVNKAELVAAIYTLPITATVAIFFGRERLMVTDWGIVAQGGDTVIGLATVANDGEMASGIPTLMGIMILPEWRRQGIGLALLGAVVEEAGKRHLLPLRCDVLTPSGLALTTASGYGPETLTINNLSLGFELPCREIA